MSEPIDAVKRYKLLKLVKKQWLMDPDTCRFFMYERFKKTDYYIHAYPDLVKFMVNFLFERYEKMLMRQEISYSTLEYYIDCQKIDSVYWKLIDRLPRWRALYVGKVELEDTMHHIAKDRQNIHTRVVQAKTNDGIKLLESHPIPNSQKTLNEIKDAWMKIKIPKLVEKVIEDMKSWGSKDTVMHATENKYKSVLRGLWAKIKSFDDEEVKEELVKRLWEECKESVGMCADGHLGRLVNVLVGFDETFKGNVSPMETFQNSIALLAESDAPLEVKIAQATNLMDEAGIPQSERIAWIEAL